jgi:TolB protein
MQADGTGRVNLTNCPSNDRTPAWSPDGTRIVFSQVTLAGIVGIYVMNSSPTGQACNGATLLVSNAVDPAWSSDGSTIAFASGSGHIYLMNPDGTGVRQLTNDPSFGDLQPAWSPDGSRIAFTRGPVVSGPVAIDVINRDGSGLSALTTSNGFFSNNSEPAWSPDGDKIAFSRVTRTGFEIFVMNSNGNADTQLTATSPISDDEEPNWQPLATRP